MIDPSVLASLHPELAVKVFEADQAREARERELWSALTQAQAVVAAAPRKGETKGKDGGKGYQFSKTEDVLDVGHDAMQQHGLGISVESAQAVVTEAGWVMRMCYSLVHRSGARYVYPEPWTLPFKESTFMALDKSALAARTELLKYAYRDILGIQWGDVEVSGRVDEVPTREPAGKRPDLGPKVPPSIVPRNEPVKTPDDDVQEPATGGEIRAYLSAPGRSAGDRWVPACIKKVLLNERSKSDPAWLALVAPFRLDAIQSGPPEIPDWLWHWMTVTPLTAQENAGILNRPEWAEQLCRQGVQHRLLDNWCDALMVGAERPEEMKARLLAAKREGMGNAIISR